MQHSLFHKVEHTTCTARGTIEPPNLAVRSSDRHLYFWDYIPLLINNLQKDNDPNGSRIATGTSSSSCSRR